MRRILLLISLACALLFGGALAISFIQPLLVERAARELIRIEVERRVGQRVDALSNTRVMQMAKKALAQTEAEVESTRREIANGIPARVARIVGEMMKADCECRKRLVERANRAVEERLSSLTQLRDRLDSLIESAYQSVSSQLMREFRIFTAANGAAFMLLALVTWRRHRAAVQTLLPAVVLVGAALITGGLYLFQQNWLHTLLYSDYVGLAYIGYLAAAAMLLGDIVFNRARLTTRLLNVLMQSIGSALHFAPC